ncbi:hypothetical protein Micbo1qcDRAFT_25014 [Microdochium bolleyi]|uniref:Uncharacterized protein n=1 Tax=Microdochium bolleyi TaxID=196109 RepID=A0A136JDL3_9PEZI|nr:hypothetical protein Micbo1qcDRAFT_25014 [Microdochium bolleyi]
MEERSRTDKSETVGVRLQICWPWTMARTGRQELMVPIRGREKRPSSPDAVGTSDATWQAVRLPALSSEDLKGGTSAVRLRHLDSSQSVDREPCAVIGPCFCVSVPPISPSPALRQDHKKN